jgi:protein TonB
VQASSADPVFREWEPRELGLAWASLLAVVLAGAIMAFCYFVSTALGPKPQMQVIQVTQVSLTELTSPPPVTELPPPLPPPPPKMVPPPKPMPVVIPPPPPVASKIVVPAKPPPVAPPVSQPMRHPRLRPALPPRPAPTRPEPKQVARPAPGPVSAAPKPAVPVSGIPVYGGRVYSIIQANQNVPPVLAQLGLSGTAVIEITVAPDGHVVAARVVKSSGVSLVDQTALEHARDAALPPFNDEMPQQPSTFLIPIEISPQSSSD